MKLYEAMFLLNPNDSAKNWEEMHDLVHGIIEREGGKITLAQKFDDTKLAYDVKGFRRATYYLVHFEGEAEVVSAVRRAVALAEPILRVLVLLDDDGAVEVSPLLLQGVNPDQPGRPYGPGRRSRDSRDRDGRREPFPGRQGAERSSPRSRE